MTHFLCLILGHTMRARYQGTTQASAAGDKHTRTYIGDVCQRCGHAARDHLSPPPIQSAPTHALIFMEGREPLRVTITHLETRLSSLWSDHRGEASFKGYLSD